MVEHSSKAKRCKTRTMPTQRCRTQQSPTERITEVDQTTGASDLQTENDGVDETVAKQEKRKWQPTAETVFIPLRLFEPDWAVTANDVVQYAILSKEDCNINDTKAISKLQTTIEDMKHTIKGCLQT